MHIRIANQTDADSWAQMRAALWPDESVDRHRQTIATMLAATHGRFLNVVAVGNSSELSGFAEASQRHDGCETSPVAFLEGIYVQPGQRGADIGRALCAFVEAWARAQGCTELASDALLANSNSHAFHRAIGFAETERVVFFRKQL